MAFPKVYTVNGPSSTSSSSLPSWLTIKPRSTKSAHSNARKRQRTQHHLGQLELIQELAFPESAIRIKTTPDGKHAIGTGTYKPMMKVWDLEMLTVKFERVTEAENVDFVILSDDWTKTLHLQRDRTLALHTQMGLHYQLRLPVYGRSLAYHPPSADALVACTGTEIFRFNLEEGRYMTPLRVAQGWGDPKEDEVEGVNVMDVNSRHGLWSLGLDGGGGTVEFWDPRSRTALSRLVLPSTSLLPVTAFEPTSLLGSAEQKLSVTALASHPTDGLSLAVGTSTGHTLLYDLRSPTPFAVKDQGYGEPIVSVDWLRGGGAQEDNGRVVSSDSKVIKIWGKDDPAANQLSLHPANALVQLHPVPNSGLLFAACNAPQLSSYYIPEIGPAPKWASFLDNVTEEMADDVSAGAGKGAYTDFKFIDKAELETLGLTHLVGTPALKPYMHGYFLSLKLYTTARLIANPQSYADYRERIVSKRLADKAESRIRAKRDQPKVNKALAERLRKVEEREEGLAAKKKARLGVDEQPIEKPEKAKAAGGVLSDPRFQDLWEDPDFEVDEESREFALLNPATAANNALRKTAVQDEEDESDGSSSGLGESDAEEKEDGGAEDAEDASSGEDSEDGDLQQYDPRKSLPSQRFVPVLPQVHHPRAGPSRQPRLVIGGQSAPPTRSDTFGQRLHSSRSGRPRPTENSDGVLATRRSLDGGMEMSFIPSSGMGPGGDDDDGGERQRARKSKVEKFGAGMEKGDEDREVGGDERGGRTRRRDVGRSASKNVFRKR